MINNTPRNNLILTKMSVKLLNCKININGNGYLLMSL
jgi:hypothetical protein